MNTTSGPRHNLEECCARLKGLNKKQEICAKAIPLLRQTATEVRDRLQEIAARSLTGSYPVCIVCRFAFSMKLIPLLGENGAGMFAIVDNGDFEWLSRGKWYATFKGNTVYARGTIQNDAGKRIHVLMHRVITGVIDPATEVDHGDGNGLNNQRRNLRPCTRQQNSMNRGSKEGSTSRFKGVHWCKKRKKWVVTAMLNEKSRYFGSFENEDDAARNYNKFAKENHGKFARYNDVLPPFPEIEWKLMVLKSSNKTGFRGVSFNKELRKFKVHIFFNGKQKYLGSYSDPSIAARIYDAKAIEVFGDAAILNFP